VITFIWVSNPVHTHRLGPCNMRQVLFTPLRIKLWLLCGPVLCCRQMREVLRYLFRTWWSSSLHPEGTDPCNWPMQALVVITIRLRSSYLTRWSTLKGRTLPQYHPPRHRYSFSIWDTGCTCSKIAATLDNTCCSILGAHHSHSICTINNIAPRIHLGCRISWNTLVPLFEPHNCGFQIWVNKNLRRRQQ